MWMAGERATAAHRYILGKRARRFIQSRCSKIWPSREEEITRGVSAPGRMQACKKEMMDLLLMELRYNFFSLIRRAGEDGNHKSHLRAALPRDICRDEFSLARGAKKIQEILSTHAYPIWWKRDEKLMVTSMLGICVCELLARQRHSALCDRFPSSLYTWMKNERPRLFREGVSRETHNN
jgi:hypothetical protein